MKTNNNLHTTKNVQWCRTASEIDRKKRIALQKSFAAHSSLHVTQSCSAFPTTNEDHLGGCMKNLIARILTVLLPAVLLFAGTAHGQYAPHTLMVTVPFEFTAGDKTFPAGDYSIVSTAPDQLSVRDSRGHVLASLMAHSAGSPNDNNGSPRLTFYSVGGGHTLTQVWMESRLGYELASPQSAPAVAKRRTPVVARSNGAGNN
jgi:hypothetical protein